MKKLNIARAGGGTGGHVFPIKSLIQHLQNNPDHRDNITQMFRFGTKKSLEQETCSELQKTIKNHIFGLQIYFFTTRHGFSVSDDDSSAVGNLFFYIGQNILFSFGV